MQSESGTPANPSPEAEKLHSKLAGYVAGALTTNLVALGDRLGIYAAMKTVGKSSSADIAAAAWLHERFVREWLHQQAAAGVITTDTDAKLFWLTPLQQEFMVNETGPDSSPFNMSGVFASIPPTVANNDNLEKAFRTGLGFGFDSMGTECLNTVCRSLGVWTRHYLADSLAKLPGMKAKLEAGIKIADVGCGMGELVFTIASAFPNCTVHGYDISASSLIKAFKRQRLAGLQDADIDWFNPLEDGQALPTSATYDLMVTMDAIHDMAQPLEVVSAVRTALKDDGCYIINDPKGLPTPAENIHNNPAAPLRFGFSCHSCLPSGMSETDGRGFGMLGFQIAEARELASAAGFTQFQDITRSFGGQMNNVFMLQP